MEARRRQSGRLMRVWQAATWLASRRPVRVGPRAAAAGDWRTQAFGWGLGLTERLRSIWRRRWLRVRR